MSSKRRPEHQDRPQWPSPLTIAFGATLAFAAFSAHPRVRAQTPMRLSFAAAAVALLVAWVILRYRVRRDQRQLSYRWLPRPVHYVQFCMHSSIYAYWGWYWPPVYHFVPLILAQLTFAYALDMLVSWFRRNEYILGFGPVPIVLSTNLFLWFKDDWFYLQFLLIATGVLGKEFVRWHREGRLTHIFNPSAFSLTIFSLILMPSDARTSRGVRRSPRRSSVHRSSISRFSPSAWSCRRCSR
jgi:hypothetical protein